MNKIINLKVTADPWQEIIHYVQYSTEILIEFHMTDYMIPQDAAARFYLKKPSGLEIYNECEIHGNAVILSPTAQTFAEAGRQFAQLQITNGEKILVSYILFFEIEKNLIEESAIPSSNEFGVLDELVKDARNAISNAENAAEAANTAAKAANAAAQKAGEQTVIVENLIDSANEATAAANEQASRAANAAKAANTATEAANTATGAANTATEAANTAAGNAQNIVDTAEARLLPETPGAAKQVLTQGTSAPEWSSDLNISTLTVADVNMTITKAEYDQLMTELDAI